MNQHDSMGRVLVNVNKPANEPDIFLPPQLAKAVHPHQVLYDKNVQAPFPNRFSLINIRLNQTW